MFPYVVHTLMHMPTYGLELHPPPPSIVHVYADTSISTYIYREREICTYVQIHIHIYIYMSSRAILFFPLVFSVLAERGKS